MDEVSLIIRRARRVNSKNIDLSNRNLTSVPQDLLKITSLETLNLSHNMLASIPDNISKQVLTCPTTKSHPFQCQS
jgi:Leucine-rich repeat (LRR) protein